MKINVILYGVLLVVYYKVYFQLIHVSSNIQYNLSKEYLISLISFHLHICLVLQKTFFVKFDRGQVRMSTKANRQKRPDKELQIMFGYQYKFVLQNE